MPVDQTAEIEVAAFRWVPDFAQGSVRDLRVRWALEELGLPYRERLLDATKARPAPYFAEQPFGQVPIFREGDVAMFESGAIVLYLAERGEILMPRETAGRTRTMTWLFAAMNSIEPMVMELGTVDIFASEEEWAKLRRPSLVAGIGERLDRLADVLGDKEHLEDRFTAADLVMTTVLRDLRDTDLVAKREKLAAYVARCEGRPAFQRALEAQLRPFRENRPNAAA